MDAPPYILIRSLSPLWSSHLILISTPHFLLHYFKESFNLKFVLQQNSKIMFSSKSKLVIIDFVTSYVVPKTESLKVTVNKRIIFITKGFSILFDNLHLVLPLILSRLNTRSIFAVFILKKNKKNIFIPFFLSKKKN